MGGQRRVNCVTKGPQKVQLKRRSNRTTPMRRYRAATATKKELCLMKVYHIEEDNKVLFLIGDQAFQAPYYDDWVLIQYPPNIDFTFLEDVSDDVHWPWNPTEANILESIHSMVDDVWIQDKNVPYVPLQRNDDEFEDVFEDVENPAPILYHISNAPTHCCIPRFVLLREPLSEVYYNYFKYIPHDESSITTNFTLEFRS